MRVGYNPVWPAICLTLGAAAAFLGLVRVGSGEFPSALIPGVLLMVIGLLQLTRAYVEFDPATRTIVVKALAGPLVRRFGGFNGGQLYVAGNRIVCVRHDGRHKKVPVQPILAKREEYDAVLTQIAYPSVPPPTR